MRKFLIAFVAACIVAPTLVTVAGAAPPVITPPYILTEFECGGAGSPSFPADNHRLVADFDGTVDGDDDITVGTTIHYLYQYRASVTFTRDWVIDITLPDGTAAQITADDLEVTAGNNYDPVGSIDYVVQPGDAGSLLTATVTRVQAVSPTPPSPPTVDCAPTTNNSVTTYADVAPHAADDVAGTGPGTAITVPVAGNDAHAADAGAYVGNTTDISTQDVGPTTSVTVVTDAASGSCVAGAGVITYTPDPGFTGIDTCTYTAADNDGGTSGEATVSVQVGAVAPVVTLGFALDNDDVCSTLFSYPSGSHTLRATIDGTDDLDDDVEVGETVVYTYAAAGTIAYTGDWVVDLELPDGTAGQIVATVPVTGDGQPNDIGSIAYTVPAGSEGTLQTARVTSVSVDNQGVVVTCTPDANDTLALYVNIGPDPVDDTADTTEQTPVVVDVVVNDGTPNDSGTVTGPDGAGADTQDNAPASVVEVVDDAAAGTCVAGPGTVTYTPDDGFSGVDSCTYRLIDNDGAVSTPATVTVTVVEVNEAPAVDAGADLSLTLPTDSAMLTPTISDDGLPDGTIDIAWSAAPSGGVIFSDATVAQPVVTFTQPGTYTLTLEVSDGELAASDTLTVIVEAAAEPNRRPWVWAGLDHKITLPDDEVHLRPWVWDDGRPRGSTLEFTWSTSSPDDVTFAEPNSPRTTATFAEAGTYELTLTVSDGELTSTDTVKVKVAEPPACSRWNRHRCGHGSLLSWLFSLLRRWR